MNDKNFIPTPFLAARRRRARTTWWIAVCATYALGTAMVLVWLRAPMARDRELGFHLQSVASEIQQRQAEVSRAQLELTRARAVMRSRAHLTERPNWGAFLSLLGRDRPSGVFLTHCELHSRLGDLPIGVTIRGFAPQQDGVSEYVITLERMGLFDQILLQHVRREPVGATTGLAFVIICEAP